MIYSQVKRKKASQLAVMLATPSHAIESVEGSPFNYGEPSMSDLQVPYK